MLAWLSAWSGVQTCIWPSGCQCYSLSLASVKSSLVLPFWYRSTQVVPDKVPLNRCVCVVLFLCLAHFLLAYFIGEVFVHFSHWSYGVHCRSFAYCWLWWYFSSTSVTAAASVILGILKAHRVWNVRWCSSFCLHGNYCIVVLPVFTVTVSIHPSYRPTFFTLRTCL